ncbi:MAG: hypothetical protein Q8P67_22560 [archaeon]|nr:hypothetical protein [archaeon]
MDFLTFQRREGVGHGWLLERKACLSVSRRFFSWSNTTHSFCRSSNDFPRSSLALHARPTLSASAIVPFTGCQNSSTPRPWYWNPAPPLATIPPLRPISLIA